MEGAPANPSNSLSEDGHLPVFKSEMLGDERLTLLREFEFSIMEFPKDGNRVAIAQEN